MTNKKISGWLRQNRYRARKNIGENVTIHEVLEILKLRNDLCGYCDQLATGLDCPFPLKDDAPFVPANILPICSSCRVIKGNSDIILMFHNQFLASDKYLKIVEELFKMKGGDLIKDHFKKMTGM